MDFELSDILEFLPANDPSFLTGMGLQFAGTAMKADRLRRMREEQAALVAAERARQSALAAKGRQMTGEATTALSFDRQQADRGALRDRYETTFAPGVNENLVAEYTAGNPGAPAIVRDSIAAQMADAARRKKEYSDSAANLASYSGQGANNAVMLTRLGQDIGRVANYSAGNSAILPHQLNAALGRHEGRGTASDLLSGMGDIFVNYSLRKRAPKRGGLPAGTGNVPIAYAGTMD